MSAGVSYSCEPVCFELKFERSFDAEFSLVRLGSSLNKKSQLEHCKGL